MIAPARSAVILPAGAMPGARGRISERRVHRCVHRFAEGSAVLLVERGSSGEESVEYRIASSSVGQLESQLNEAARNGFTVADVGASLSYVAKLPTGTQAYVAMLMRRSASSTAAEYRVTAPVKRPDGR